MNNFQYHKGILKVVLLFWGGGGKNFLKNILYFIKNAAALGEFLYFLLKSCL